MSSNGVDLDWQRTSLVAVVFFLVKAGRQLLTGGLPAVAVVAAAFASAGSGRKTLMLGGFMLVLAIGMIISILSWLRFRFCIRGNRVLVRSGVLHREELSVDFGRVQNVSIREPFYMRPFGLALLSIDTAGSGQKEIVLGGIKKDLAVALRETILATSRVEAKGLNTSSTEPTDPAVLLSRNPRDIVIYGLTVNFLLWFAIAIGAVFGAHEVTEDVFTWLSSKIHIQALINASQSSDAFLDKFLIATGLMFLVLLLLPLISVLGALFRHYGYQLSADGETYRKNSGLLTRHDESIKRHKIQAIVLKQNFVARLFKRTNMQLRVASAGTGTEQGQLPAIAKNIFVVPALHASEVNELGEEFLPGCEVKRAEYSRVDRHRFTRVIFAVMVIPLVAATSVLSILLSWKFVAILPITYGIAWMVVSRYWQMLGYAVVGEYGYVRRGFFGTEITAFPLFKVQRIDIRQSPGQRRRGLAHLSIHLASHSLSLPHVRVEDVQEFRDIVLYHVESSNIAWY